jgi:hypothetical protein
MEAATAVPAIELPGVIDATGTPLVTGDRVNVTGSDRFGEGEGTVIGAVVIADYRIVPDGEVRNVMEKPTRIRVRMDNGTDGDEYTASAGRVTKLDTENAVADDVDAGVTEDGKQDGLDSA